jgi:hypothetical protein
MLSLDPGVSQTLIELVGLGPDYITPHGDLPDSTFDGPALDPLYQTPAYAQAALVRSHDQAQDFARATGFQDLLLGRMDPPGHSAFWQLSYQQQMLRTGEKPFNPPPHDSRFDRIAE